MKIRKMENLSETTYWNVPDILCTFFKYNPIRQPITYRWCSIGDSAYSTSMREIHGSIPDVHKTRAETNISKTQIQQKKTSHCLLGRVC